MFTDRDYLLAKLAYDTYKRGVRDTMPKFESLRQDRQDLWAQVAIALQNEQGEGYPRSDLGTAVVINTNDTVRVELTVKGLDQLHRYIEQERVVAGPTCVNGVVDTHLWQLMRIFGQQIDMGSPQLFRSNEIQVSLKH